MWMAYYFGIIFRWGGGGGWADFGDEVRKFNSQFKFFKSLSLSAIPICSSDYNNIFFAS